MGAVINHVGKLALLRKYIYLHNRGSMEEKIIKWIHSPVTVLLGCGIAGITVVLVDIPLISTYMFIILLCGGLAVTVVNAATVEIYPTNLRYHLRQIQGYWRPKLMNYFFAHRAMAMCVSLMMGRMGSVFGTNTVAYLLDDHCESVFLLSGSSLIVCAILCCFIPNIRKTSSPPKNVNLEPRMSITSRIGWTEAQKQNNELEMTANSLPGTCSKSTKSHINFFFCRLASLPIGELYISILSFNCN